MAHEHFISLLTEHSKYQWEESEGHKRGGSWPGRFKTEEYWRDSAQSVHTHPLPCHGNTFAMIFKLEWIFLNTLDESN
jgi:hypothetical protein